MIRRNKTWELQVFAGYIRHTGILLPKERFMKWGHHPHKFPKVNGPSWISTLWRLKKGNNHIPTISPKIVPKMFEFVNRVFFNDPREFLPECREFLPECRVFLPDFFAKKTHKMSQCAWNFRTCSKSKLILKTSQFIWVAPDRSHQTCSGLWAPAPGHILRSAHVPTFTVPFQFLTAFNLKQELSGENNHELNSCLQTSYRNSRLNWISRLQSIYLSDCEKVYFLCSAQNISLNGDLGMPAVQILSSLVSNLIIPFEVWAGGDVSWFGTETAYRMVGLKVFEHVLSTKQGLPTPGTERAHMNNFLGDFCT